MQYYDVSDGKGGVGRVFVALVVEHQSFSTQQDVMIFGDRDDGSASGHIGICKGQVLASCYTQSDCPPRAYFKANGEKSRFTGLSVVAALVTRRTAL